ncbi:hypothetical protein G7076_03555 [Sphingomonas sp. HDW15A]|uniref:phosphatase PAP2 family protein n=1 Tax=Sphingomonas sp. HDW15A TaxID=2714942 RepID=UPI0014075DC7|nr:phosphatase PAP2 family protein [Sphingomonas sp. HDW15A]QIK95668.1 hypothetical protein G7076_03555 [Sphingomonas sp. HDW15A]
MGTASDRSWLIPSVAMTGVLALFVILFAPAEANYRSALGLLPLWTLCAVVISLCAALPMIFAMMRRKEERPIATMTKLIKQRWKKLLVVFVGFELAGLNMIAFMWAKPLLNYLVPFWADPLLLKIDSIILLGVRPDRFLAGLNTDGLAIFYHRFWFAMMVAALLYTLTLQPSRRKSALLLTYFALWTFVGPIVHSLLPAGGPIFYERLGHGHLFVPGAPKTNELADYLWSIYSKTGFGPGAGISAMPSLHIATIVWVCIVARGRWRWPTYAASFLIFLLSMSLGWHYAVDGIVGGFAAIALYRLMISVIGDRRADHSATDGFTRDPIQDPA